MLAVILLLILVVCARHRRRHRCCRAWPDLAADRGHRAVPGHLAEIVRLDRAHHREVASDTELADAVKLLARAHQNLSWECVRHVLRLRSALLEFFPAVVQAFPDLAATDSFILLGRAPDPARAAKLTRSQVVSALTVARRHHIQGKAEPVQAALQQPGFGGNRPPWTRLTQPSSSARSKCWSPSTSRSPRSSR